MPTKRVTGTERLNRWRVTKLAQCSDLLWKLISPQIQNHSK